MPRTPIDESYDRLIQIRSVIKDRKRNALANPTREDLISEHFVDLSDDIDKARQHITKRFDELLRRSESYAKLDMCAVFERTVIAHIDHTISGAKDTIRTAEVKHFRAMADKFVREPSSFESIDSIIKLVEGHDAELYNQLRKIRTLRNEISHGTEHLSSVGLSGEAIRDALNDTLKIFDIV